MPNEVSDRSSDNEARRNGFPPMREMLDALPNQQMERTLYVPLELLERIFGHLDHDGLLKCRLVNRAWNDKAIRALKPKLKTRTLQSNSMIGDFSETVLNYIPEVSLSFEHLRFHGDRSISFETAEQLLDCVSHQVKSLKWKAIDKLESLDGLVQLVNNLFPNLEEMHVGYYGKIVPKSYQNEEGEKSSPNTKDPPPIPFNIRPLLQLKRLHIRTNIETVEAQNVKHINKVTCFIKELIDVAANLQHLKLVGWDVIQEARMERDVMSSITSREIRKIKMDDCWASAINVNALLNHRLQFPLTILQLEIDIHTIDLQGLLKRCFSTLVELDLTFTNSMTHDKVTFPFGLDLKMLRRLKLQKAKKLFCIDFDRLPNIQTLQLSECFLENIVKPRIYSAQLESVKILQENNCRGQRFYRSLTSIFSDLNWQLTSLEVALGTDFTYSTRFIFEKCTTLKYLNLNVHSLDDAKICGFKKNELEKFVWPKEELHTEASLNEEYKKIVAKARNPDQGPFPRYPFIGDLRELQVLVLSGLFSELSILYGIMRCGRLTRVQLDSFFINSTRATRIIRYAGLRNLTGAMINSVNINRHPPVPASQ